MLPDVIAPLAPQSRKPAAKPRYDGKSSHSAKPIDRSTSAPATSRRREKVSAHAPDGISSRNPASDQIANSDEIWPPVSPASANSSAYTG